jgi:hypothetical protein
VAERALLAREQADGTYVLATSRWGGTDSALAAVCAGTDPTALPGIDWEAGDAKPDFTAVVATLDVLGTELCYRVAGGRTTIFLPLWFGLPLPSARPDPGVGAVVAVDSLRDARALRRQFRSLKCRLTDAATAGTIQWATVPRILFAGVAALTSRERYYSLAGTAERLYPETGPDGP